MTREEAIKILSTRDAHGVLCGYTSGVTEAIDMAISALSVDGDLISRETLLKKAEKANITKYSTNSVNIITTDVVTVENIKKAPSAEKFQPRVETSDLISRADAIEAVCDKCPISFKEKCEWKDNGHCSMNVALSALPSAEAIQGEWIKTVGGNGWNEWWVFKCPFCGATIEDKQYRSWEYNYCLNCGAKMIEGGDNE